MTRLAVPAADTATVAAGVRMFARYAHAPNALGYCGPPSAEALAVGGTGGGPAEELAVRTAARRFSGAWPYLQVLARLTGIEDPLDHRLVEAYWLGGDPGVDPARFGAELLTVIGPQAGHYWTHLTPELLAAGAPDHGFHVFGVYPWSRLLGRGHDEQPLHVLDSCRIRWGTVLSRRPAEDGGDVIDVESRRLTWDGTALGLGAPTTEPVRVSVAAAAVDGTGPAPSFVPDVRAGDLVALHWDRLTDRLTAAQVATLERSTLRELARVSR